MSSHLVSTVTGQFIPQSGGAALSQGEVSDWQAQVVAVYAETIGAARLRLRQQFSEQLRTLTGCVAPKETIAVDSVGRSASAVVDGALFLLRRDEVVIVRPCAYCRTGRFVSEPLERQADLGYALAVWAPYHRDCEPVDPSDDVSW
jgi:hypothetical protein